MINDDLQLDFVRELFLYDQYTGSFKWRIGRKGSPKYKNAEAGAINDAGYIVVCINKKKYRVHRLIWLYMTGVWPEFEVDHINCIGSDNRWENLREATGSQNTANQRKRSDNISGVKGVSWDKTCNKWRARVKVNGKETLIGYYNNKEDGARAYANAAKWMHGKFARVEA